MVSSVFRGSPVPQMTELREDVVLLEQVWVHDGESKVKAVVEKAGASITRFVRFHLGEGIEKEATDFAAEVAAAAGV